jgi:NarL family two-component system response regulator LiaR
MNCVGSTTELLELPALIKHKTPQVLVLDIAWLGDKQAGIRILPDIRNIQPRIAVVMITVYPELLEPARQAGAYPLSKGFSRHELLNAIRWAARCTDVPPGATPAPAEIVPLTSAEQKVLELLARGMSDMKIAGQLKRSVGTVKKHVSNILGKLGVSNRTEAAILAERYNLLPKHDS